MPHLPILGLLQTPLPGALEDFPNSIEKVKKLLRVTILSQLIKLPTHSAETKEHTYNIPRSVSEGTPHALKATGKKRTRKFKSIRLQTQELTGVKLLEMGLATYTRKVRKEIQLIHLIN